MRNILEHVRKRDYDEVKRGAQAIYRAQNRRQAETAFLRLPSALAARLSTGDYSHCAYSRLYSQRYDLNLGAIRYFRYD